MDAINTTVPLQVNMDYDKALLRIVIRTSLSCKLYVKLPSCRLHVVPNSSQYLLMGLGNIELTPLLIPQAHDSRSCRVLWITEMSYMNLLDNDRK